MIGSENGRSAETYAVTCRAERSAPPQPPARAAVTPKAQSAATVPLGRLFRAIREIVERRDAVRLRPETHLASLLEGLIVPLDCLLTVEGDREVTALKIHAERVPLVRRDLHVGALLLGPPAVDGVIDRDVVFERVRPGDIVVVGILRAPDD